jgi:tetratricopeptide (TPR) repeat protein
MIKSNPKQQILGVVISATILLVLYMGIKWQSPHHMQEKANTSTGESSSKRTPGESNLNQETVTRTQFLMSLFKNTKPPAAIARYLLQNPNQLPLDSLKLALKWAQETRNAPLVALINSDMYEFQQEGILPEIARESVFLAASQAEDPVQKSFLFQQGKKWIDSGLIQNPRNMQLRNALLVYQSEFLNQPMAFLQTLKESQKIDSNDLELNFIHLNLLKKSNQIEKAIKKCEKLVSLQPQNPYWLYELSDIYGQTGDSVNAKIYLNLAVKLQRNTQDKNK